MNTPPVSIAALPDGIAITAGEPLKQAVAARNVYVTLDKPQISEHLFKKVAALDATLHNIASLDWTFKAYKTKQRQGGYTSEERLPR